MFKKKLLNFEEENILKPKNELNFFLKNNNNMKDNIPFYKSFNKKSAYNKNIFDGNIRNIKVIQGKNKLDFDNTFKYKKNTSNKNNILLKLDKLKIQFGLKRKFMAYSSFHNNIIQKKERKYVELKNYCSSAQKLEKNKTRNNYMMNGNHTPNRHRDDYNDLYCEKKNENLDIDELIKENEKLKYELKKSNEQVEKLKKYRELYQNLLKKVKNSKNLIKNLSESHKEEKKMADMKEFVNCLYKEEKGMNDLIKEDQILEENIQQILKLLGQ